MTRDDDHDEALELDALPDRFGDDARVCSCAECTEWRACKCATCEPTGRVGGAPRPCCHTTGPLHHPACQESAPFCVTCTSAVCVCGVER